jgi:endonuclease/exonuclease/phosphatase (EEP) superfamily protein YafD
VRWLLAITIGALSGTIVGGLLDGIVWPGPPLALFRPQLTLLLLAVTSLALIIGPRRMAIVGIAAAGVGAVLLIPAFLDPEPERPASGQPTVKLLTLNLWHRNDDIAAVTELIRREQPDIVALIELTPAWQRGLSSVLEPYRIRALEVQTRSTGIGVYGRAHARNARIVRLFTGARAAVEVRVDVFGRDGRMLVVHPIGVVSPLGVEEHKRELEAIGKWARDHGPMSAVCGDLNAAPWTRSLRDVLADAKLHAALPGGLFAGSWPALPPPLRVAIDGCLVGAGLRAHAELGPRVGSDHLPVLVEFA